MLKKKKTTDISRNTITSVTRILRIVFPDRKARRVRNRTSERALIIRSIVKRSRLKNRPLMAGRDVTAAAT